MFNSKSYIKFVLKKRNNISKYNEVLAYLKQSKQSFQSFFVQSVSDADGVSKSEALRAFRKFQFKFMLRYSILGVLLCAVLFSIFWNSEIKALFKHTFEPRKMDSVSIVNSSTQGKEKELNDIGDKPAISDVKREHNLNTDKNAVPKINQSPLSSVNESQPQPPSSLEKKKPAESIVPVVKSPIKAPTKQPTQNKNEKSKSKTKGQSKADDPGLSDDN